MTATGPCFLSRPNDERIGLIWIGTEHYPTPEHFQHEARTMGVSRRISKIPRGFILGETWVALAHRQVRPRSTTEGGWDAGVFTIFQPQRIERITSDARKDDQEFIDKLSARDITPVWVPAGDPDHGA
jgi:hypothetical protein